MKRIRMVAHTPVGVFTSRWTDATDVQLKDFADLFESQGSLTYLRVDTEIGTVWLRKETVNASALLIETEVPA